MEKVLNVVKGLQCGCKESGLDALNGHNAVSIERGYQTGNNLQKNNTKAEHVRTCYRLSKEELFPEWQRACKILTPQYPLEAEDP